jgi:tetratricopeptide (TPR) repeat protein
LTDYQSAYVHLKVATAFDGADASVYLYLARTEIKLGHSESAVESYREAINILGANRRLIWYRYELAKLLLELDRLSEAEEVYRNILRIDPENEVALESLRTLDMGRKP